MKLIKFTFRQILLVTGIALALPAIAYADGLSEHEYPHCEPSVPASVRSMPNGGMRGELMPMGGFLPEGGLPMPFAAPDIPPFLHDLKLSDVQEDKIFMIVHTAAPILHEQLKLARQSADAFRNVTLRSAQYDEMKMKTLADSHAHALAEIMLIQARTAHQIYVLLTLEQQEQVDARRAQFEQSARLQPTLP